MARKRTPQQQRVDALLADRPRVIGSTDEDPNRRDKLDSVRATILEKVEEGYDGPDLDKNLEAATQNLRRVTEALLHRTRGENSAGDFVRLWLDLRRVKDEISSVEYTIGLILEATSEMMIEKMERDQITSLKLQDGRGATFWLKPRATINDPVTFREWVEETPQCAYCGRSQKEIEEESNPEYKGCQAADEHRIVKGNPGLRSRYILHPQTLTAVVSEMREAGFKEPPGVEIFAQVVIRKL